MDYVLEDTEMPDHLVKNVEGVELYHAHNYQVSSGYHAHAPPVCWSVQGITPMSSPLQYLA